MPHQLPCFDRVRRGDREAFGEFYDATVDQAHRLALLVVGEPDLAASVLGEAYLEAWVRSEEQESAGCGPLAWLLRLVQTIAQSRMTPA